MRQYVWLIRYGKTSPGLLENIGNYDSDLHYPEGIDHAEAIGKRLASGSEYGEQSIPKLLYSDPFLRCMRTADIVAKILNATKSQREGDSANNVKVRLEEGTTEWQVPSLLVDKDGKKTDPRSKEKLSQLFPDTIDQEYCSVNPQGPDRSDGDNFDVSDNICPRFPETEAQLHARCRTTLNRICQAVGTRDSFAIVGHAPCVQSMALALEGAASPADCPGLGPWSLGGMTLFSRPIGEIGGKWTMEFFSDTCHMPGEYTEGRLGQWSLPSFDRSSSK